MIAFLFSNLYVSAQIWEPMTQPLSVIGLLLPHTHFGDIWLMLATAASGIATKDWLYQDLVQIYPTYNFSNGNMIIWHKDPNQVTFNGRKIPISVWSSLKQVD